MKNHIKKQYSYVQSILLEQILARWRHPVASVESLNLLYRAMRAVAYRRIAMAIRMASKVGVFVIVVVLYMTPAAAGAIHSRYLPNGKYPVASTKALNLLHWAMHLALPRCIRRAIKTASKGGAFVLIVYFGIGHKRS
jgi:hypothetical protein